MFWVGEIFPSYQPMGPKQYLHNNLRPERVASLPKYLSRWFTMASEEASWGFVPSNSDSLIPRGLTLMKPLIKTQCFG